ncbi:MAG TPA: hypothetical protein VGS79_04735 [Puia sp.]|nr:hypothetical protein [Puia sp.]
MTSRKIRSLIAYLVFCCCSLHAQEKVAKHDRQKVAVRGWNILTDNPQEIDSVIDAAGRYDINHLQLSHNLIMDLRQVKDAHKQAQINGLIEKAHNAHIREVTIWDHALYDLAYYPDKFKTGPGGTIDLDNPDFWKWFRQDYRNMMTLVPNVDGLILTFIETGARAEQQYSRKMGRSEKLAKVINNVADVVIGELGKKLYIRTFAYTDEEYQTIIGCMSYLKSNKIILMMKETPHDFFLTHPDDQFAGTINRPTIIEFDEGNEFNGQGVIANTWPEHILRRWKDLEARKHVIGYVARTDRFGNTSAIGRPSEILLYALKRYSEDTTVTAEMVYDEFISAHYGPKALPWIKKAFKSAYDIVTSSLYTLGTCTANHSNLNFDPYSSSYTLHVSGRWIHPPVVFVRHDVNKQFHYWKDIIQHIAPARFKTPSAGLEKDAPDVLKNQWVTPQECMDEEYLNYLVKEKHYAVKKAAAALVNVEKARAFIEPGKYKVLYNTFYRTLLTTRLYEAVTKAYFGYRIYARGETFRTKAVTTSIRQGLADILSITGEMEAYNEPYPKGSWDWKGDARMALTYYSLIAEKGWPEYGGIVFKNEMKNK